MPTAAAIARDVAGIIRPPRRVKVSEAAAEYMRIALPGGYAGPWSPSMTPYMVEPMDCLTSRRHEAVCFVGPARTGKTQALVDGLLVYAVCCDPGDMLIIQMTQDQARDYSRRRIKRLHRNSPEMAARLSPHGHDDNLHDKVYRHGMILSIGWPTASQLSSRDIRYVAMTDYDRMPDDIDGEGDPFTLGLKRTQTFMSGGMCLVETSPGRQQTESKWTPKTPHEAPPTGGALSIYNRGDRRRWYGPCPHCREYFTSLPSIDAWHFDRGLPPVEAGAGARLICTQCGALIEPAHKRDLLTAGRWLREGQHLDRTGRIHGDGITASIASFWLPGAAAVFQTWASIVTKYLHAEKHYEQTGEEEPLRAAVNLDIGGVFLSKTHSGDAPKWEAVYECRGMHRTGEVPEGVLMLTAGVDVQKDRLVFVVRGWAAGGTSYLIDYGELQQPGFTTAKPEPWERLSQQIHRQYHDLPIRLTVIDSGYNPGEDAGGTKQDVVYQFCRANRTAEPAKGYPYLDGGKPYYSSLVDVNWNGRTIKNGIRLWHHDTDVHKSWVHGRVEWDRTKAGGWFLPADITQAYCQQIVAEERTLLKTGRPHWIRQSKQNHYLDCEALAYLAARIIRADCLRPVQTAPVQPAAPIAATLEVSHAPLRSASAPTPRPARLPGSGWGL